MYYSVIGVLATVILLLENFDILLDLNGAFEQPAWKVYRRFLIVVLIYYFTDILWGFFESRKLIVPLFIDTSAYFLTIAIGARYWTKYVVVYLNDNRRFSRFLIIFGRLLSASAFCFVIANIFKPVLFSIDENCVYYPLGLRYILLNAQIIVLVLLSIYAFASVLRLHGKTDNAKRYRTISLFGLIMSACLIAQLWFAYLPLYAVGYMLGTCILRVFIIRDEKEEYRSKMEMAAKEADQVKHRLAEERMEEERIAYTRINSLTGNFLVIYIVVPQTGRYREYSSSTSFENYSIPKEGLDFFAASRENVKKVIHPGDLERFLTLFTMDNVMAEIRKNGLFAINYRLMVDSKPHYVQLKAALVDEKDGRRLIVGVNDIDSVIRQEDEYKRQIEEAQNEVNFDALTGARSKHAYLEDEDKLNIQIKEHDTESFAIAILDVNDLKKVNDTFGHQAGDQYIRDAYSVIRTTFRSSNIYRVGGDEFAVIIMGKDYENVDEIVDKIREHNIQAIKVGGVVIACGMSRFENDESVDSVFERADQQMYENKYKLKASKTAD